MILKGTKTHFQISRSYYTHPAVDKLGWCHAVDLYAIGFRPVDEEGVFFSRIKCGGHGVQSFCPDDCKCSLLTQKYEVEFPVIDFFGLSFFILVCLLVESKDVIWKSVASHVWRMGAYR